ncbi:uncharacterized protein LOC144903479 isoform X1 [Branchiostoma floridae x Branchiostoma belcheri]
MQGRVDNCAAGRVLRGVTFLHNKVARRGQGICIEHFEGDSELKKNIQHHYIPVIQLHSEGKWREDILHRICQSMCAQLQCISLAADSKNTTDVAWHLEAEYCAAFCISFQVDTC